MSGNDLGLNALKEIREHLQWLRTETHGGVREAYPFIVSSEDLCEVLQEMEAMIGSDDLKLHVAEMIRLLLVSEGRTDGHTLHTVITGIPGTGKTTWAKLLARAWAALGALKGRSESSTSIFLGGAKKSGPIATRTRSRTGAQSQTDSATKSDGNVSKGTDTKDKSSETVMLDSPTKKRYPLPPRFPPPHVTIRAPSKMFPIVIPNDEEEDTNTNTNNDTESPDRNAPVSETAPSPDETNKAVEGTKKSSAEAAVNANANTDVGPEDGSEGVLDHDPNIQTLNEMLAMMAHASLHLNETTQVLDRLSQIQKTDAKKETAFLLIPPSQRQAMAQLIASARAKHDIARDCLNSVMRASYKMRVNMCFQALFERNMTMISDNIYRDTETHGENGSGDTSSSQSTQPKDKTPEATDAESFPRDSPKGFPKRSRSTTVTPTPSSSSADKKPSQNKAIPSDTTKTTAPTEATRDDPKSTDDTASNTVSKDTDGPPPPDNRKPNVPPSDKGKSKVHYRVVSRENLVAGYVGQTADKTRRVLESMRGGVLVIDEAYALKQDEKDWFGQEAINTINLYMSEHADSTVVIFAGYKEPTEKMLKSNPGMLRRIGWRFNIDTYNPKDLARIFLKQCRESGWSCDIPMPELYSLLSKNKEHFGSQGGDTFRWLFQAKLVHAKYNWKTHRTTLHATTSATPDSKPKATEEESPISVSVSSKDADEIPPEKVTMDAEGNLFVDVPDVVYKPAEVQVDTTQETTKIRKVFDRTILEEAMEKHVALVKKEGEQLPEHVKHMFG